SFPIMGQSIPKATSTRPKTMSTRDADMAGLIEVRVGLSLTIGREMPVSLRWRRSCRNGRETCGRAKTRPHGRPASSPGLDIDIIRRRSPEGEWEQLSINLRATPSFEAFGRLLGANNPFTFWM